MDLVSTVIYAVRTVISYLGNTFVKKLFGEDPVELMDLVLLLVLYAVITVVFYIGNIIWGRLFGEDPDREETSRDRPRDPDREETSRDTSRESLYIRWEVRNEALEIYHRPVPYAGDPTTSSTNLNLPPPQGQGVIVQPPPPPPPPPEPRC